MMAPLVLVSALSSGSVAADPVTSQADACKILTNAAERIVRAPKHPDEFFCQSHASLAEYYVFSLRSRSPTPPGAGPDWVGSNLVGWFGVRRRDGAVMEWDIADEVAARILHDPSKVSK